MFDVKVELEKIKRWLRLVNIFFLLFDKNFIIDHYM